MEISAKIPVNKITHAPLFLMLCTVWAVVGDRPEDTFMLIFFWFNYKLKNMTRENFVSFLSILFCFAAAKPREPDERYRMTSVVELERREKIQSNAPFEDEKIAAKEVSRNKNKISFRIETSQRVLSTQTAAKERMND